MNDPAYIAEPLSVISNRAPYQLKVRGGRVYREKSAGGLVSVLDEVMRRSGGSWVAWGDAPDVPKGSAVSGEAPNYSLQLVKLSETEVRNYYQGFSNRVLWPLSHYFLDRCHFRSEYWKSYRVVNQKFADAFLAVADGGQRMVWVHDFHLTLLPLMLRQKQRDLSVGFFWHIPFPPSPVFRALPWRSEVLEGLLGSDLIGFQTPLDAGNFLRAVADILGLPVDRRRSTVEYGGRLVRIGVFPVGIDYDKWNEMAVQGESAGKVEQIRSDVASDYLILGADRLDYTKGILERMRGYERFLEKYPQYHERVCLLQIAVPSRTRVEEYRTLRRSLDEAIGRISGRFSTRQWAPIRYLYKDIPMEELVNYYAAADVALITPLRDGMNLVAEEYAASQSNLNGCLILSEFAGAAGNLPDALLVNPYDFEQMAEALHRGLSMGIDEKKLRMRRLRRRVSQKNVYWWCESFLRALKGL